MAMTPPPQRSALLPRLILGLAAIVILAILVFLVVDSGFVFDEGDMPQLIGLLAILAFIVTGIIGRQTGAWQVIRALTGWAAIILVVAGLYASRESSRALLAASLALWYPVSRSPAASRVRQTPTASS